MRRVLLAMERSVAINRNPITNDGEQDSKRVKSGFLGAALRVLKWAIGSLAVEEITQRELTAGALRMSGI